MPKEPFFPYFMAVISSIAAIVGAYAPEGKGQDAAIGIATGAMGGSMAAYTVPYRFAKREDPPP